MYKVDLNSDIGESFGNYKLGLDEEVAKYISSANIACGWHAGDPMVMAKTIDIAVLENIAIGAHPGFPDLMGFGRRNMNVTADEAKNYIKYQIGALWAFAKSKGAKLQHVKTHGAFYNMAAKDPVLAEAIAQAVYEVDKDLILLGLANSQMINAGKKVGLRVANEVFADRAYNTDGTLVSRLIEGAVIHDKDIAISRVVRMVKEGKVEAINGEDIDIKADSICVHGDNPQAVEFVKNIRQVLEKEGVDIIPIGGFIND
ncbi:MAG: LamB/YcsF family protein [Tissierellia bacterium]|nr:LamB/YcsF family protein [Tissierellia bacterium]MDD4725394.1 LamB/YcsF family protein [Tissierellia bacterium]